jgi:putative membrane protein
MAKRETQQQTQKRILILCVDRDGDLETKAAVKTPLLGRTANIDGAVSLAIKDPEEPDANAMFEAVRIYDRLQKEKQPDEVFEVATISGTDLGGVNADRKLVAELKNLQETFNPNEVILVSDGYSDEAVLPLVESRVPVSSVRRIVIKHSESIEETAAVFTKYIRLLIDNPRYARMALGLPGILVLIFGVLWYINSLPGYQGALSYYGIAILVVLGGFLLLKGFGVDKATRDFYTWAKDYEPPPLPVQISNYTIIAGILCIAVSVYLGVVSAYNDVVAGNELSLNWWLAKTPEVISIFILAMEALLIGGIIIVLLGRSIRLYFERNAKLLRNVALIVTVAWSYMVLDSTARLILRYPDGGIGFNNEYFSNFIFTIIVGILIGVASVLLIYIVNRSTKGFFKKTKDDNQETPEEL